MKIAPVPHLKIVVFVRQQILQQQRYLKRFQIQRMITSLQTTKIAFAIGIVAAAALATTCCVRLQR